MRSVQTARADDVTVSLAADVAEAVASPSPETASSGGPSTGHPRLRTGPSRADFSPPQRHRSTAGSRNGALSSIPTDGGCWTPSTRNLLAVPSLWGSWPSLSCCFACRRYRRAMRRTATGVVLLATMLLAGACGSNGTTGEPAPATPSSATSSPTSSPTSVVLTCSNAAVPLVRAVEEGITASGGGIH